MPVFGEKNRQPRIESRFRIDQRLHDQQANSKDEKNAR